MIINPFRKDPDLDEAIASAFEELKQHKPNDPAYKAIVEQLTELSALKPKGPSADAILTVVANTIIGWRVLKFEETGVVTTKLWNFFTKMK